MQTSSAENLSNGGRFRFLIMNPLCPIELQHLMNDAHIFYQIIQRYRLHIRKFYLFYL